MNQEDLFGRRRVNESDEEKEAREAASRAATDSAKKFLDEIRRKQAEAARKRKASAPDLVDAPELNMMTPKQLEKVLRDAKKAANKALAEERAAAKKAKAEADKAKRAADAAVREQRRKERAGKTVSALTFEDIEQLIKEARGKRGRKKNPSAEILNMATRGRRRSSGSKRRSGGKRRRSQKLTVSGGSLYVRRRRNPSLPDSARSVAAGFGGAAAAFGVGMLADKVANPWGKVAALTVGAVGGGLLLAKAGMPEGAAILGALSGTQAVTIAGFQIRAMAADKKVSGVVRLRPDGQIAGVVSPSQLESSMRGVYDRDAAIRGVVSSQYPGL